MHAIEHSVSCPESNENDHCVDKMAPVDVDGRRKTTGNHELICANAEEKMLKKQIRNIVSRKYRTMTEEEYEEIANTKWNMLMKSLQKLQ